MHEIVLRVNDFLTKVGRGETNVPPELSKEFGALCQRAYDKHFGPKEPRTFSLRPSNLGRPLCQLWAEKNNWEAEPMSPDFIMKMYQGDILEASAYITLKAAGLDVSEKSTKVKGSINGHHLEGELDLVLDGRIWDIKGTSRYSFDHKASTGDAATWIGDDDPFGYLGQIFTYSRLRGLPVGGWITVCRDDSRWAVVEIQPHEYQHFSDQADKIIGRTLERFGQGGGEFAREFTDEPEFFRRSETGNRILKFTCSMCKYKWKCWPGLQVINSLPSEAKNKTQVNYTHIDDVWKKKVEE